MPTTNFLERGVSPLPKILCWARLKKSFSLVKSFWREELVLFQKFLRSKWVCEFRKKNLCFVNFQNTHFLQIGQTLFRPILAISPFVFRPKMAFFNPFLLSKQHM
jgi:hypothetical protein